MIIHLLLLIAGVKLLLIVGFQAYRLAGQFIWSMQDNKAYDYLKKNKNKPEKYKDKRQEIEDIISKETTENKSNLSQIKSCIEEKFDKSLSCIDNAYIERKYMKLCSESWQIEAKGTFEKLAKSKSWNIIRDVFNSLDTIQNLSDVPDPFKQLEYYKLLTEPEHTKLIDEENNKILINQFKMQCLEQILNYSDSVEKELIFLETLIDFLNCSKNNQSIIVGLELEVFYHNDLSFDKLIKNIMKLEVDTYGENLKVLKEAIVDLKGNFFLVNKFKEIIGAYIKPVELKEREIDGRLVIEVTGKNVVVSQIVKQLENKFSENIEEVRFVGANIIHVDEDFKSEVWHGKNIVILAKTIKVHDKVTWDVSGKDSNHIYTDNAGTSEDGHGKQGEDGYPGESGGNVLILVEKVENPENFTIISNGGKGSKGQDGGNGNNGEDGVGITTGDFDKKFPSAVKSVADQHIRDALKFNTVDKIKKDSWVKNEEWSRHDVFLEVTTNKKNEITFSYCYGLFSSCQAFLLYEGSLGQSGGQGGEYGLGGQGGYAGEIIVRNIENSSLEIGIVKRTEQVGEGEKGQGGLYGSHGKNGWDMGYLDYQFWKETKFRGRDENSKCTLEYYDKDNSPSDRVWCPYKRKYVGITTRYIEHKKQKKYEERKNTRKNDDRKHQAKAVRKKNISQSSVLSTYSHHFSSIKSMMQNLQSNIESTKQGALRVIVENQKEQEKQTAKLRTKRHSPYQNKSKDYSSILTTTFTNTKYKKTIDVTNLIDKLEKKPSDLNNWFQLKNTVMNLSQLSQLFPLFKTLKSTDSRTLQTYEKNSKLKDIEKLLLDKYRLTILEEIVKQLPLYLKVSGNEKIMPESAVRYLIEAKENNNIFSHPVLGTLNQYFYENNEQNYKKIFKYCKQNSDENCEIMKASLITFILEVGESEGVHLSIKKYYDEFRDFLEKQKHSLSIYFEAFKSEISQSRHAEIFTLWIENIIDKSLKNKLEEKIHNDKLLNAHYNRLKGQLEQKYDWNKCCQDQAVIEEHNKYIQEKGLSSKSYRELLAYIFDINIRVYVEDLDNKFSVQDDHNPSAKQTIYILCRDQKYKQLNIDENYLKLEEERKKIDGRYAQIFAEINSLKCKKEFDDYLKNKAFLSNNNSSEVEQSFDEKKDIEKIIKCFPEGERQQLKGRLDKISSQYVGQQEILHNISKRFFNEGRYVSSQELYFLINSILSSVIEGKSELNIFCWIVAAHPQTSWTDELILLQIENYLKKTLTEKPEWRKYLSKIKNKDILLLFKIKLDLHKSSNSISKEYFEDTLHLLSNISNETVSLEGLELSEWSYALKEKYWTCKLSQLADWEGSDLSTASYYLLSIENIFGALLVEKFMEALKRKKRELSSNMVTEILSNFHNEKWNLCEEELNALSRFNIDKWMQKMQQKFTVYDEERKIMQLVKLITSNANTSKTILNELPKIQNIIESIDKFKIDGKLVGSFTENDIKNWMEKIRNISFFALISGSFEERKCDITETLAVIDRAIELKRKFKLRDTQRLTVLALLTNNRSTLAQVSTGEGKSLIVVAASIMKSLCGEKVDVITSSSVLAKRDAEDNRDIYDLFGINVSHNCSEDVGKRKEAYSDSQVVYGDLSNFQRDYLLDKFYGKNILGDRKFENVIVDEVDSMLLDKGNSMLYLSHDLAGFDKLESVYIYIWQWINRPAVDHKELSHAFNAKAIKEAVLHDLYGLIKIEDITTVDSALGEVEKNTIWERLIKVNILDDQGKILKGNIHENELNEVLSLEFECYKDRLRYLLKECVEREKFIHVPNYLKPFIEQHLDCWINSAVIAFFMKAGEDYVVDVDKTATSPDRNPNITILDRDTGTDQTNSQWDEALHQFLQLKHGCKLSLQSLKAVFISNVSFFKSYKNLYGLTGTLGSKRERDLLKEIHEVEFVTIPTASTKKFHEDKPILCTGKKEWIEKICNETKKLIEVKKRSVLIICETVNDVEMLYKGFGGKNAKHVHTYTRDYEEFDEGFETIKGSKELNQGQIIIATNLAGRGTDIKITKGLRSKGGLHVCLSYLPNNIRVEQQAFGRSARSGDSGSGQLIIMNTKGRGYSNSKVLDMKKGRDTEELHRISDIKACYDTQITTEENCFKSFKKQYEQLKKDLDDKKVATEVKEILLQSCLDKWAFWLDEHNKYILHLSDKQNERNLNNQLDKFISQLKKLSADSTSWPDWVEGNPIQMIKLGKYLSQNKKYENAIQLFNEVIKIESNFSVAAHYYKAFVIGKKSDWERKSLKDEVEKEFNQELRKAARLLDKHSKFAINAANIIGKIKKNNNESIIQIDAYEEQQKSLANLYYIFSRSIDDIFGHTISPQSFFNYDIKEDLADYLYNNLLKNGILERPKVEENIAEEDLKVISSSYGASIKELKCFLFKYNGKEIDEKEFQKSMKADIKLPDRNAFWKLLIQEKILSKEVKCVEVNNEKLKEIDPSLLELLNAKIDQEELKKQSIELDNKEILLHAEWVTHQKDNTNIFKKDDLTNIVGKDKYKILKEKRIFSINKKAYIDSSKIESSVLTCYDSITIEDFTNKANISKSDAEIILAQLVMRKVLEKKDDSENSAYKLKIRFNEIDQVRLPSCPVYENDTRALLFICFTYRIALQKLVRQLEEKNLPICLQLMANPHQGLFFNLLDQEIIRPTMVTIEDEDLDEKLKSMYSQAMAKDKFKFILSQDKLIPKQYIEKLFTHLIEKNWIVKNCNPIQSITEKVLGKENIEFHPGLPQDLYYINSPDKRQTPLNFNLEDHENIKQNIDKTVEKVLDNLFMLSKDDTIKNIVSTLKKSKGSLKAFKVPNSKLKPFTEICVQGDFANIEEVHLFLLNGLDQLLLLDEKKWTRAMLFNTAVVAAMGVCQIAIGAVIELYSVGIMTHVGAGFINEGVSDLFFAMGALKSGYFSWKDYGHHKLVSLMMTTITVGIGAYLSRGAKVSRIGYKLAGPDIGKNGMRFAEMGGKNLIEEVGLKTVGKEVVKRIALKSIEGVAFGLRLATVGVDALVENHLQILCDGIASEFFSNISYNIEKHNISVNLEKIYKELGRENAKLFIDDITKNVLTRQSYVEKFLHIASKISNNVIRGIEEAVKKRSKTSNNLELPVYCITQVAVWSERVGQLVNLALITNDFLDKLNQKMKSKLNSSSQKLEEERDYESFKKEVIDKWKLLLHEKAGQIIAQHIVTPILTEGANRLVKSVGEKIQEGYQSFKESGYFEFFEKLKQEYEENLQDARQFDETSEVENQITKKYHKDLIKLMAKTKNSKLFAAIIRENVPMDMTCVDACTKVIHKMLEKRGIRRFAIIIEGEDGIRQKFSSGTEGVEGLTIKLQLKDNHFQFDGNCISDDNRNNQSNNNCLFEALSEKISFNMTPEDFRTNIADYIEHSPDMQYLVEQGWHKFSISKNAFGGRRTCDSEITAHELKKRIINKTILSSQTSVNELTRDGKHIGEVVENMNKVGYVGDPVKAVMIGDFWQVLDHRRIIAAAITQSDEVKVKFALYMPDDEFSDEDSKKRFGTSKAGEAARNRMEWGNKKKKYDDIKGFPFETVTLRRKESDYKGAESTLHSLRGLGLIIPDLLEKTQSKFQDKKTTKQSRSKSQDRK